MVQHDYLIIADNEVQATSDSHEQAQFIAMVHSKGRYPQTKVIYLPNRTLQGVWHKGKRIQ